MPYTKVGLKTGDTITQAAIDTMESGIAAAQSAAESAASAASSAASAASTAGDPGGRVLFVRKSGNSWPARPTDRSDVMVLWVGADPSPAIVSSGTGGMLDGVDARLVSP